MLAYKGKFRVEIDEKKYFLINGTGMPLENKLFWRGVFGHEPATIRTFIQLLEQMNWIADIGSNSGLYALVAATLKQDIEILAVEPSPLFYDMLISNVELNKRQIICINKALSNHTGFSDFYFPRPHKGNPYSASLSLNHLRNHRVTDTEMIKVEVCKFDDLVEVCKLQGKGLVKIDAEGHGVQVLEGMKNILQKSNPVIIIEVQSIEEAKMVAKALLNYFFYRIHELDGLIFDDLPIPFYDGCNNYLCSPQPIYR